MPRAERREQIARAAAAVFMRGGFDGTSMDDVARQAGVTRLIVYRIFESKDDLYRAVLDDVTDRSVPVVRGRRSGAGRACRACCCGVARRHPDAFRLLWRQAAHEPAFAETARVFRDLVTAYTETLIADATDDPLMRRWMAQALVSYHYEGVCTWLDEGDVTRDDEFVAMSAGRLAVAGGRLGVASAPALIGCRGRCRGQPGSTASIAETSGSASGATIGLKRVTVPSGAIRNFSKFHRMSPLWPSESATCVRSS